MDNFFNEKFGVYQVYNWGKYKNIAHGFFGHRQVIDDVRSSVDRLSYSEDEYLDLIKDNSSRCKEALSPKAEVQILNQVHGADVLVVTSNDSVDTYPAADAMVTKKRGIILAVKTADCVPILFHDPVAGVIAAVHAGWRGAYSGVIEETIKSMVGLGADKTNIVAAIGPCIHQPSYEVDVTFYDQWMQKPGHRGKQITDYFIKKEGSFYFDLAGYCYDNIYDHGMRDISIVPIDTYANPESFFSYRYFCHKRAAINANDRSKFGCQFSAIVLL